MEHEAAGWQPVFVNIGPPLNEEYIEEHGIKMHPVLNTVSPESLIAFRLYVTPQTMLVDSSGRIRQVWKGELLPAAVTEIHSQIQAISGKNKHPIAALDGREVQQ